MTVLVTGATGNTGAPLVELLRAEGAEVRAASRRTGFDWSAPDTHPAALAGVHRIYLVAPVGAADPEQVVEPFLRLAVAAGVRRVVLLSSSALAEGDPGLGRLHRLVRELLPEWTVLRPSWFMQNIVGDHPVADGVRRDGVIVTATGAGRVGFVDAADIAAVAARALLDDVPHNTEHVITGPSAVSYPELAALLTELTGRPVRHVDIGTAELADRWIAAGYPAAFATALAGLDEGIRHGAENRTTDTVLRLAGRPPRSLRDFLTAHLP